MILNHSFALNLQFWQFKEDSPVFDVYLESARIECECN